MSRPDHAEASAERPDEPIASIELLYRRHQAWLLRAVRRLFGADQAEDLVQEIYVRAASYQGRQIRNPRALLIQIGRRAAIDRSRRAAVRPTLAPALDSDMACPAAQAEALALKQIILKLPRRLREVFVLSRFAGMTYEDIAEHLGISVKTVEGRMTAALKACAEVLAK